MIEGRFDPDIWQQQCQQFLVATGISVSTISRVLNRDETIRVSTQTEQRIFEVAQQLGYAPAHRHGKGETRRGASRLKMGIAQMAAVLSIFCMVVYKRGYRLTDEFYHHVLAVLRDEESRAAGE